MCQTFIKICGVGTTGSILQVRKPRHRDTQWLAPAHTASKWQSREPGKQLGYDPVLILIPFLHSVESWVGWMHFFFFFLK